MNIATTPSSLSINSANNTFVDMEYDQYSTAVIAMLVISSAA